jgi:Uncharacterised methyltransferase family (DUF6094)
MRYASVLRSSLMRTPRPLGARIVHHLLSFPSASTVLDPTAGEGDLLFPTLGIQGVHRFGVEIDAKRAAIARTALGGEASIITAAFEAVHVPQQSMSAVLANPPAYLESGVQAAYTIIRQAGEALLPGGIMVAIIPARLVWDNRLINHWCQWYGQVRVWKFPDRTSPEDEGGFEDFTQICVVGVRRAEPIGIDPPELSRLQGYRWRARRGATGQRYEWEGDTPPEDLPTEPIPDPYAIPFCQDIPQLAVRAKGRQESRERPFQ